jgi:group I intron endonuclease
MIGIYKITNRINGKSYVGQSINMEKRFKEHLYKQDAYIDRAIHKYGKDNFNFEILEQCSQEDLNEKERYYINKLNTKQKGYNIADGGAYPALSGYKHSQAKLNKKDVSNIVNDLKTTNISYRDLASKYKVSTATITLINKGKHWGNNKVIKPTYYGNPGDKNPKAKIGKQEVADIILLLKITNLSSIQISKKFNVSPSTIQHISEGNHYLNSIRIRPKTK